MIKRNQFRFKPIFLETEYNPRKDKGFSMFTFLPLQTIHFSLLQKWMNSPHLANTWNEKTYWSLESISEKYLSYTKGYKEEERGNQLIHAFIIQVQHKPIGYIQYYNAYDFSRKTGYLPQNIGLPSSLAALDFYIGDTTFLGKGLGTCILQHFLDMYIWPQFKACFVDPNQNNKAAIRTYEKVGFHPIKYLEEKTSIWMLLTKSS